MISYKDLARHEAKYKLHPVRQLREMHNYADPVVMKHSLREQYLRQPKAVTVSVLDTYTLTVKIHTF